MENIEVSKVMKVNNPYLNAMYDLKRSEYISRYKSSGKPVEELLLFHSTRQNVVDSIVTDNLNWRLVNRSKFGRGNCFSSDANYANCHANRYNGENRVFIICKVLVCKKILGSSGLNILPREYDTSTGGRTSEIVYVKFDDNEFVPQFLAYYKCSLSTVYGSKYNSMPRSWFN